MKRWPTKASPNWTSLRGLNSGPHKEHILLARKKDTDANLKERISFGGGGVSVFTSEFISKSHTQDGMGVGMK